MLLAEASRPEERLIEAEHETELARADFHGPRRPAARARRPAGGWAGAARNHRAVRRLNLSGASLREIASALCTIYNAPSGFREFGVQNPDGCDIAFGQPL